MTDQKAFYDVGLHHCKITSQRFYMQQNCGEKKETIPVFEVCFDVMQKVNPTDNKMEEHSQKFNRTFQTWIKGTNFDVCYEQISSLLRHAGFKETLKGFDKLDPDKPGYFDLVGKVVPMWCSHQDNGWERWQPSSDKKKGKKKDPGKNDPDASEYLNSMFGSRLENKAAQQETETVNNETTNTESFDEDDVPF